MNIYHSGSNILSRYSWMFFSLFIKKVKGVTLAQYNTAMNTIASNILVAYQINQIT